MSWLNKFVGVIQKPTLHNNNHHNNNYQFIYILSATEKKKFVHFMLSLYMHVVFNIFGIKLFLVFLFIKSFKTTCYLKKVIQEEVLFNTRVINR